MGTQFVPNTQIKKSIDDNFFNIFENLPVIDTNLANNYMPQTLNKEFTLLTKVEPSTDPSFYSFSTINKFSSQYYDLNQQYDNTNNINNSTETFFTNYNVPTSDLSLNFEQEQNISNNNNLNYYPQLEEKNYDFFLINDSSKLSSSNSAAQLNTSNHKAENIYNQSNDIFYTSKNNFSQNLNNKIQNCLKDYNNQNKTQSVEESNKILNKALNNKNLKTSIYNLKATPKKKNNNSHSVYTEVFRRIAESPADPTINCKVYRPRPRSYGSRQKISSANSGYNNNNDNEETNCEKHVMCLACRGVYPSRRSLTGHIGRSEKCREMIGRNYLIQLSQQNNNKLDQKVLNNVNPICPHCDRFISHYKGNTRRHVNQCRKLKRKNGENNNVINGSELVLPKSNISNFNKTKLIDTTKNSEFLIKTPLFDSVVTTINSSTAMFPLTDSITYKKNTKKSGDQNNNNSECENIILNKYLINNITDNNSNKILLKKEKNFILPKCKKTSSTVMSIKKNCDLITMKKEQNENQSLFKTTATITTTKKEVCVTNNSPINFTQKKSCEIKKEDLYINYNEQLQHNTNNFLSEKETNKQLRQEIKCNESSDNKNEQKWLKNFKTNICNNTNLSIDSKLESTNYEIMQTDKSNLSTPYYIIIPAKMTDVVGAMVQQSNPSASTSADRQHMQTIILNQPQHHSHQHNLSSQEHQPADERSESIGNHQAQPNFQHMNTVHYNLGNGSSSFDNNNNNSNNSNGENIDNGQTFTTLTTFRSHLPLIESNGGGDEYVPNGGNLVFSLPPGVLMSNGGGAENNNGTNGVLLPHSNGNGLTIINHVQHSSQIQPNQQLHPQHIQLTSEFMQNSAPPQSQQFMPHIGNGGLNEIDFKKDPYMVVQGAQQLIVASSSSGSSTPQPHHLMHTHHPSGIQSSATTSSGGVNSSSHLPSSNSAENSSDPYLCAWCTFTTVYKGNMKRHLISCHNGITDDLLRRLSFDVDRLRKNCPNRPHIQELPILPKAPRQPGVSTGDKSDKPKVMKNSNGSNSGRKRSTNLNGNNTNVEVNRGRPRKNAKNDKTNGNDDQHINVKDGDTMRDESLRINGNASASPSSAIPARLNGAPSSSSSPSLPAVSSGPISSVPPSLITMGHSLPPNLMIQGGGQVTSIPQIHHAQFAVPHSQSGVQGPPPGHFVSQPPQLFMVMNPNGTVGAPLPFSNQPTAIFADPSGAQHLGPQLHQLAPPSHNQQQQIHHLESVSNCGQVVSQPIYIPSQQAFHYQPSPAQIQQIGGAQFQHLTTIPAQHHQIIQHQMQNNAFSAFKPPLKECSNDSGISLHSFNTGVDL